MSESYVKSSPEGLNARSYGFLSPMATSSNDRASGSVRQTQPPGRSEGAIRLAHASLEPVLGPATGDRRRLGRGGQVAAVAADDVEVLPPRAQDDPVGPVLAVAVDAPQPF